MNVTSWVAANIKTIQIVRTIEFPFAYSNGELVYPNKLRKFGHGMARALKAYAEGEVLEVKPCQVSLAEVEAVLAVGGKIATLGPRILRCETAPLAAIAVLMEKSGNMA